MPVILSAASILSILYIFSIAIQVESKIRLSTTMMNKLCKSVVICGPSGVGKGTIISRLLKEYPAKLGLSVSHTSRKPREGEINGLHYHFVTREYLENDIRNGPIKFIETAQVHANLYGTRADAVESVHRADKVCVLDLDTKGVQQVKSNGFPARLMFIAPPSLESLEERLRNRGTESEEQVRLRVANAREELEYGLRTGNFDAVLVNEDIEDTYKQVVIHFKEWFPFLNMK